PALGGLMAAQVRALSSRAQSSRFYGWEPLAYAGAILTIDSRSPPTHLAGMRRRTRPLLRVVGSSPRTEDDPAQPGSSYTPNALQWSRRVYAIAFDLDTEMLSTYYPSPT